MFNELTMLVFNCISKPGIPGKQCTSALLFDVFKWEKQADQLKPQGQAYKGLESQGVIFDRSLLPARINLWSGFRQLRALNSAEWRLITKTVLPYIANILRLNTNME